MQKNLSHSIFSLYVCVTMISSVFRFVAGRQNQNIVEQFPMSMKRRPMAMERQRPDPNERIQQASVKD